MMKFWNFVLNCVVVGVIAFAVGVLLSFLINLILSGKADVAWAAMFENAVIVGIMIPLYELIKIKKD
jgi:ABC-type Fe3+ transport system permease subunit